MPPGFAGRPFQKNLEPPAHGHEFLHHCYYISEVLFWDGKFGKEDLRDNQERNRKHGAFLGAGQGRYQEPKPDAAERDGEQGRQLQETWGP